MASIIDPATSIGLIRLSVGNLDRSLSYYQHNIGLVVLDHDNSSATLGVGDTPLLHLREMPGARVVRRATGLYHFALRVPSRRDLALVIRHLWASNTEIGGASDHLVSEALYLSDPDGHGIEIYRDRPRDAWYDEYGAFRMSTVHLDLEGVLAELGNDAPAWNGLPAGSDMGHIHLQVADVGAAERFYVGVLGLERMASMPSASFISAGGYHHHIGLNSWAGFGVPAPPESAARLLSYELCLPTDEALNAVLDRVRAAEIPLRKQDEGWSLRDPSQNTVILRVAA
jgi:catechol 2,3-dioxygenase